MTSLLFAGAACTLAYLPDDSFTKGDPQGSSEAGPIGEGGLDGPAPGDATTDAEGGTFCQRAPATAKLCDEFEREALLGDWSSTRIEADAGGVLGLGRDDAGGFLRSSVKAQADVSRAYLRKVVPGATTKVAHFAFRMRLDATASPSIQTMVIGFGSNGLTRNVVGITLTSGMPKVFEQTFGATGASTAYDDSALNAVLPPGVFHDIDMKVTLDTSPAKITVTIDGAVASSKNVVFPIMPSTFTEFEAGLTYGKPTPTLGIDVDDVLIETE